MDRAITMFADHPSKTENAIFLKFLNDFNQRVGFLFFVYFKNTIISIGESIEVD